MAETELARAKKKAMNLLIDMDRTEKELHDKLIRAGFTEEASAEALQYVKSYGYIDDVRYAGHYLEVNRTRKSRKRLRFDLEKKGISREILDEIFFHTDDIDEKEQIRKLVEKKRKTLDLADPRQKNRLLAFLARRGYGSSDILQVIEENVSLDII
ncbi:MAG: recombination regulator RecX [Lachnospiraceae bacterium]|nr:recombination regulator RecX [Lachnospiraceae bacterium]